MSRFLGATVVIALIAAAVWALRSREAAVPGRDSAPKAAAIRDGLSPPALDASMPAGVAPSKSSATGAAGPRTAPVVSAPTAAAAAGDVPVESPIVLADPLNSPRGTLGADLDTLRIILEAWRSNFPYEGNPVGENVEITAALTGRNPLQLALIPKNHPAINAEGQLCDRWGTPFRFHQISADRMELRSAGPDKQFGTADDGLLPPP
ncbi:MAG TPA: hypothetical protein VHO24_13310 [Opitutaceae bacterium]|nr:hypothetical protein [Opitutaceae bacterium]